MHKHILRFLLKLKGLCNNSLCVALSNVKQTLSSSPHSSDPPCTSIVADSLSNRLVAKSLFIVMPVVKDTPRCCSRAKAEESESQGAR